MGKELVAVLKVKKAKVSSVEPAGSSHIITFDDGYYIIAPEEMDISQYTPGQEVLYTPVSTWSPECAELDVLFDEPETFNYVADYVIDMIEDEEDKKAAEEAEAFLPRKRSSEAVPS